MKEIIEVIKTHNGNFYRSNCSGLKGEILGELLGIIHKIHDLEDILNKINELDYFSIKSNLISKRVVLDHIENEISRQKEMRAIIEYYGRETDNGDIDFGSTYLFEIGYTYGIIQLINLSGGEDQMRDYDDQLYWYNNRGIRLIDVGFNNILIITKKITYFIDSTNPSLRYYEYPTKSVVEMLNYYRYVILTNE